uniref:SGF29 C-terminal domain-containing protein n=1 Tax=Timema monikensis TaxID=170555 RepID=A0A7R9E992_9NEOP|nr:unnamed protein product [Timema monikensis]
MVLLFRYRALKFCVLCEDFVNLDEHLAVCGELRDAEILADAMNNINDSASLDEKGEQTKLAKKPISTSAQAMDHIEELRWFVERQHRERLKSLHRLVHKVEEERVRNEHNLNNIAKLNEKFKDEDKNSPYYQVGDMVAALVKITEEEENWILAEVVQFNAATNKYEVDDIDEQKDRHILSRRRVVPLPLMRANPETDPQALFQKESVVMALYPQTTCFYKAVVNQLPTTSVEEYEVLFEDPTYADGYSPPLTVAQRYVISIKDKKGKSQS